MKRAVLVAALVGCGGASTSTGIAMPATAELVLSVHARGVQHYRCDAGAWVLVAPEATLFGGDREVGTHGAGPTWTHTDGSSVVGREVAASSVDATAIPWLRLEVVSRGPQPGVLADVRGVMRRDTTGGLAPAGACDPGGTFDAPYTARYVFYR